MKAILAAFLLLQTSCGYRLGRIPASESALQVGEVHVASADAAYERSLSRAMGNAISRRASIGSGPIVDLELVEGTVGLSAPQGAQYRLSLKIRLSIAAERNVVVSGQQQFRGSADPAQSRKYREAAIEELGESLVERALVLLLLSEEEE